MTRTVTDSSQSVSVQGRLLTLNDAGLLDSSDCVVAARVSRMVGEDIASDATLALAFAVRAVREGSSALDLSTVADLSVSDDDESTESRSLQAGSLVQLPEPNEWLTELAASPLVRQGVLRIDLGLVYLDRYHLDEQAIAGSLRRRLTTEVSAVDPDLIEQVITNRTLDEAQQAAVRSVAKRAVTVLTGGPGMGKTYTISAVLEALQAGSGNTLRIGLAAPTGKARGRMNESLQELLTGDASINEAVTVHRLLGSRPDNHLRFKHNARNPLPHDVVVIDEASMVSLSLMARLLEAVPDTTRLLLVGDPDQLTSVEAGSVLADVVRGLDASSTKRQRHSGAGADEGPGQELATVKVLRTHDTSAVVRLTTDHRLHDDRADLAQAFRDGDPDAVLAAIVGATSGVRFVETDEPTIADLPRLIDHAARLRELALAGEEAEALACLSSSRLLCAHRTGPFGTRHWNRLIERALAEQAPDVTIQQWYVGRPILLTRNDYGLGVSNGDTGVIVNSADGPVAVIETASGTLRLSPWRLSDVETMHAMTVHKAQGSQAADVTVLVPPVDSRLLTRELLYTAVTRAQQQLTIVGSRESVRAAVEAPARRSSGLAQRLAAD